MKLHATYEGEAYNGEMSPFHPLHGGMEERALWEFLRALCSYGGHSDASTNPSTPKVAIGALLARKTQVLGGGIVVVKGDFYLFPGCCCGLEGWSEWKNLEKGGRTPWLGHDPNPWIDTSGDKIVLHNSLKSKIECLEVNYEELSNAAEQTSLLLSQFLERLRSWLKQIDPENSERLCMKISEWFNIKPLSNWPEHLFDGIDWEA